MIKSIVSGIDKVLIMGLLMTCCIYFPKSSARDVLTEARIAYFFPTYKYFTDVFSHKELSYTFESSLQISKKTYTWVSLGFMHAVGVSHGGASYSSNIHLDLIPVNFGLKYIFDKVNPSPCMDIRPYVGAGFVAAYSHINNSDSPYLKENRYDWSMGGIAKGGLLFQLKNRIFFDIFSEYTTLKIKFHDAQDTPSRHADFGGVSVGLGMGYTF